MSLKLKIIYTSVLLMFTVFSAHSQAQSLCVLDEKDDVLEVLSNYSAQIERINPQMYAYNDKFKHCVVSCVLSKRCDGLSTRALGFIKEFVDVFGAGNAEVDDLVANYIGIEIAEHIYDEGACFSNCQQFFPFFVLRDQE